jgi:hypothetical protein
MVSRMFQYCTLLRPRQQVILLLLATFPVKGAVVCKKAIGSESVGVNMHLNSADLLFVKTKQNADYSTLFLSLL